MDACPFNALYWHFLARQRERLGDDHRLRMPYRNLDGMAAEKREALWGKAEDFLQRVERDERV